MRNSISLIGLFFIATASILVCLNIFSGLALVDRQLEQAEGHLIRAISIVFLSIIGNLLLLKKLQEFKEKKILQDNIELKSSGIQQLSIACIVICVISLITGTIANPGSFPLLHGLLGFSLVAILLASSSYWAYFVLRN